MAFVSSQKTRLITGPFPLSAYATQVSFGAQRETIERTSLADTTKAFITGIRSHTLSVNTMLDSSITAGAYWDTVSGFLEDGTLVPVSVAPEGYTAGNRVFCAQAYAVGGGPTSQVSGGVDMPLSFQTTGVAGFGQAIVDLAALTETTSSAAVDNSAATSNGGLAILHVSAVSGTTPTCDVIVEHSTTGVGSWATLATFAQVTTTATSEAVAVSAGTTVRRYMRITATIAGTNPSYTLAVAFARA